MTTRILLKSLHPYTLPGGVAGVVSLPRVCESMSEWLRAGIERHRVLGLTGQCPCGARPPRVTPRQRKKMRHGLVRLSARHAADCPAHDDVLKPGIEAWLAGGEG